MTEIKEIRLRNKLTQKQMAESFGVSLRSYVSYENDESKIRTIKYQYILNRLKEKYIIDESHGILELEEIKKKVSEVLSNYDVDYCIMYGSYAKNKAKDDSDIDLLISTKLTGLKLVEIIEKLRVNLSKNIDLININQLDNNIELANEIFRDGIRIYG